MTSRRSLIIAASVLAMSAGATAAYVSLRPAAPRFHGIDVTGVPWGRDFALTDHHGRARRLADFRGKVVALFFGFTNCPDMCPTTLAMLGEAVNRLGAEANRVQGLFVTVDAGRDTPQILSKYVPAFHPSFLGLYGDAEATDRTAKEFKVFYNAQPPDERGSYSVDHSGYVFVFDRQGRLRLVMRPQTTAEIAAQDLRTLLRESDG